MLQQFPERLFCGLPIPSAGGRGEGDAHALSEHVRRRRDPVRSACVPRAPSCFVPREVLPGDWGALLGGPARDGLLDPLFASGRLVAVSGRDTRWAFTPPFPTVWRTLPRHRAPVSRARSPAPGQVGDALVGVRAAGAHSSPARPQVGAPSSSSRPGRGGPPSQTRPSPPCVEGWPLRGRGAGEGAEEPIARGVGRGCRGLPRPSQGSPGRGGTEAYLRNTVGPHHVWQRGRNHLECFGPNDEMIGSPSLPKDREWNCPVFP